MRLLQLYGASCKEKDLTCSCQMYRLMSMPSSKMASSWVRNLLELVLQAISLQLIQAATSLLLSGESLALGQMQFW